ncbi:Pectinesterase, catalytic [Sesbania bispinosa]|nr:Pectinesterase, catalytic [Sesbania bispinosa]
MTLASSSTTTKQVGGRRLLFSNGFPDGLFSSNRKLLQTTPKVDIVVAQDDTVNYKTISKGVAATAKLSGKWRVVIHVKAGVYKEC